MNPYLTSILTSRRRANPAFLTAIGLTVMAGLGGCGGGGDVGPEFVQPTRPPLAFEMDTGAQIRDLAPAERDDDHHMPVYASAGDLDDGWYVLTLHVGVKPSRALKTLAVTGQRGETTLRHGRVPSGVHRSSLAAYLHEAYNSFYSHQGVADRYVRPPPVRILGQPTVRERHALVRAVQILNAALPEAAKLQIGAP